MVLSGRLVCFSLQLTGSRFAGSPLLRIRAPSPCSDTVRGANHVSALMTRRPAIVVLYRPS
jgi:hypothetical protein